MTTMTWEELDALECRCGHSRVEPVPGMEQCLRCKKCGGWGAIAVQYLNDPEKAREAFKKKPQ